MSLRVALIAVLAAVVAVVDPPAPTGSPVVDAVLIALGVAATVLIGALAPWWAVGVGAGAAMAIAADPLLIAVAAIALGAALWIGATRRDRPDVLAIAIGLSLDVLARAELDVAFGVTAIVGLSVATLIFVTGLVRQPRPVRRVALVGAGALVVFVGVAAVGFGISVQRSRDDLVAGVDTAERAVDELEDGRFDEAADSFRAASELLEAANGRIDAPWSAPAALVPVVAQHRTAVLDLSGVGADGTATVADALDEIDLDALRAVDGRFDLDALAALDGPLGRVRDALDDVRAATGSARSPWLAERAVDELDDVDRRIGERLPSLRQALRAVDLAPAMLGGDGPRTYLVLFTTPSEARGLGGFVGSYAELEADDGRLTLGRFGRSLDLDAEALAAGARVRGQERFLRQYGRFGFDTDGEGAVGDAAFRNLAMSPDFPTVAEIATDLYAQTTGRQVDGVVAMDPFVVASLLDYTGPIRPSGVDVELTADTAVRYLLLDQYVIGAADQDARADVLGEAAALTFDALLAGALPDPVTVARDLGPLAGERRLLVWSADAEEQALLGDVGVSGAIPSPDGADGWAVTVSNSGGSKIDSFLERRARYDTARDPDTGELTATLHVELTNTAPADGLPDYVIGNLAGLPRGTSRLYVSVYSPLALTGATLDGASTGLTVGEEGGWNVYSRIVDIPAGATASLDVDLAGTVTAGDDDDLVTFVQPMATPLGELG